MQEPPEGPITTTLCRNRPLQLLVAPDSAGQAKTLLYWDDGVGLRTYDESKYSLVHFTLDKTDLKSNVQWWAYGMPSVNKVTVLGQKQTISNVMINQVPCKKPLCEFQYSSNNQTLIIFNVNIRLDSAMHIKWIYKDLQKVNV